jgi:cyclase
MMGYDFRLCDIVREMTSIPMTILGGAGSLNDIKLAIAKYKTIGVAAGSIFVFKGKYRAVLINYPSIEERYSLYQLTY